MSSLIFTLSLTFLNCLPLQGEAAEKENSKSPKSKSERSSLKPTDKEKASIKSSKDGERSFTGRIPTSSLYKLETREERLLKERKYFWKSFLVDDKNGILETMNKKYQEWENLEEFEREWNLENTGLYSVSMDQKKSYLEKNFLKYLDRQLTDLLKSSAKSQTSYISGESTQSLIQPTSQIPLSKEVNVKFKAKPLQGKAIIDILNPYLYWSANIKVSGKHSMEMGKEISSLGIKANIDYQVSESKWEAAIAKKLSSSLSSKVSSVQSASEMAFSKESDKRIEFNFDRPF